MGIPPAFVPDHLDSFLSYTVVNYLKKVKQQVSKARTRLSVFISANIQLDNKENTLTKTK